MFDIKYLVEGVSKREYISKKSGKRVAGYNVYISYSHPRFGCTEHAEIWVSEDAFIEQPISYGDTLQLVIAPSSGRLLAYTIKERSNS